MLAAVFLVRLAVEEGWIGPGLRSLAAAALGVALVVAGEWLARRPAKGEGLPDLAPAALAAAAWPRCFGAAYAATVLYALLPPLVGFLLMAAAGAFGLLLSLRRGRWWRRSGWRAPLSRRRWSPPTIPRWSGCSPTCWW